MLAPLLSLILAPLGLSIQRSSTDITPPEPLPLGGYTAREGKRMDPGGDPLYARTLLFTQGNLKVALVSVEMLTVPDSLAREVRAHLPADIHLFLCATHTHCAPDSQMLNDHMTFQIPGIATFKRRWLDWYAGKIADAINGAASSPARQISSLNINEVPFLHNRGRRPGADPETLATYVSAKPQAPIFFHYAAHPVFYGPERNQTSGDWPGAISKLMGASYPVLMGAIGDVSPAANGSTPEQKIAALVDDFAKFANAQKTIAMWKPGQPFSYLEEPIKLDPPVPHPDFIKNYKVPAPIAQTLAEKFAPKSASVTAVRLGSLAIIGIPGEPTSHLGRRIRSAGLKMGFRSVLVVSHVNGWIGYILDAKDYAQGGYEATLSMNGPNEGEHVVAAVVAALRGLVSNKNGALDRIKDMPHSFEP